MIFTSNQTALLVQLKNKMRRVKHIDVNLVQMMTDLFYVLDILVMAKDTGDYELGILAEDLFNKMDPTGSDEAKEKHQRLLDEQLGIVEHDGEKLSKADLEVRQLRDKVRAIAAEAQSQRSADFEARLEKFKKFHLEGAR